MSPIKMQTAQEDSTETDRENSVAGCINESDDKVCVLLPTEGGKASTSLDPDISDVLFGLCPEDLSFSFHTSHDQTLSPSLLAERSESDLVNVTAGFSSEDMQVTPAAFFGLPMKVKECLKEYRKIDQLYGKCLENFAWFMKVSIFYRLAGDVPQSVQRACWS